MKRREFLERGVLATSGMLAFANGIPIGGGLRRIGKDFVSAGKDIRILTLEGTPKNRGRIHGEALRGEIHEVLGRWKDGIGRTLGLDPDSYVSEFFENTNFMPSITRWTPDLLEEVEGLAEGAGLDFKTMYVYQLADEDFWYSRKKALQKSARREGHCSALGVFDPGSAPLLAQNMDLTKMYDGTQVLLRIKHTGSSLESHVFSFAGFLALTGVNNRPLGICCNTLLRLNYSTDGLPVAFIVRRVLELGGLAEAEEFLRRVQHASGQNYTIGGSRAVAAFECSSGRVSRFMPRPDARRVYHTNHPLVNDDQSIYKEIIEKLPPEKRPMKPSNSEVRFDFLARNLGDTTSRIGVEEVKSMLASTEVPICFDGKESDDLFTLGCLIMELSSPPVLHLSPGPPCTTPFRTYRF